MTPAEVKQTLLANVQHEWSCEVHPRNIETATSFRGRQGKSPHCTCKVGKAIKEAEDMMLVHEITVASLIEYFLPELHRGPDDEQWVATGQDLLELELVTDGDSLEELTFLLKHS